MHEGSILAWLLIGLVAGVLAKAVMPGRDPGGVIVAILVGIAGALLAGFVTRALDRQVPGGWHEYAAATAGAVVLLGLYRVMIARRTG